MKNYCFLIIFLIIAPTLSLSQGKKKIDHTVYNSWNSLSAVGQSASGNWITYEINPGEGDGKLYITSANDLSTHFFPRGKRAQINYSDTYFVFLIEPQFDSLRKLKLDGVKKDKLPKDSLGIYWMATDSILKFEKVKSYKMAEEGEWLAIHSTEDLSPKCPEEKKKKKKKKNNCVEYETSGSSLTVINPITGNQFIVHQVTDYSFDRNGNQLAVVRSLKGDEDSLSLYIIDLNGNTDYSNFMASPPEKNILSNQLAISNVSFDHGGTQLVCLTSIDTNKKKTFELAYWNVSMDKSKIVVDEEKVGLPEGHAISEYGQPQFSMDGTKIFVGTNEKVKQEPKDTLLEDEKAKVDVWSTNDPRVQPEQLNALRQDLRKTFLAVYFVKEDLLVQLADETMDEIRTLNHDNANYALGISTSAYMKQRTWEYPWKEDVYLIDLMTGNRKLINEGAYYTGSISPSGNFYCWYNPLDSNWHSLDIHKNKKINLTELVDDHFESDNNGQPTITYPKGGSGWTLINGKEYFLVNSTYDLWALNPADRSQSLSITNQKGNENGYEYRLQRLEYDSLYIDFNNVLIHGTDDETKAEAFYRITIKESNFMLEKLIESDHLYNYVSRAKDSDKLLFRRMNFYEYPDLFATDMQFHNPKQVTITNPQQSEYNWGTVSFESWTTYEGRELRGLLYKPEDFDSTKSYPMIVYYYEKYTENIHYHYIPKPTASIVYPTEYASNGYIIFIPDIEYTPGHPAKSAYDCIMSGTDHLIRKYNWIDSTRMGLQGQSWGGYQTAQLVTMTDRFAAAMAGAPVSNMISAYGGIRWGSGLSRMFQYENTQSRIGYTIWERPDLYIENSPVFGLPNVNTPLLIMHNDNDGAVPWYQGIEMYMGLRRLGKTAWLLNYNGDEHNLMKTANRKDLSIRMRQFFDYYLLGAPMPMWMKEGVPATEKGENYGLDLENSTE